MTPTTNEVQIHPTLGNSPVEAVLSREVTPLIDQARALIPIGEVATLASIMSTYVIQDEEGEKTVADAMRKSATWTKKIAEFWKPRKQFWDQIHDACVEAEKNTAPDLGLIRQACDKALRNWQVLRQQRAREQQKLLDQAAEVERQKLADEARIAAMFGQIETAQKITAEAQTVRAAVVMQTPAKLDGVPKTEVFTATCEDVMLLLKAVAAGTIPLEHEIVVRGKGMQMVPLFTVNPAVLNFFASKLGTQFNWPGVKVEQDTRYSVRAL